MKAKLADLFIENIRHRSERTLNSIQLTNINSKDCLKQPDFSQVYQQSINTMKQINESSNIFFKQNIQPEYINFNDNINKRQLDKIKHNNQYLEPNFLSVLNTFNPLHELVRIQKRKLLGKNKPTTKQNEDMLINDEQMLIPEDQVIEIPEAKKQETKNNDNQSMNDTVIGELEEVYNVDQ